VYGLEWTPENLIWYIDGQETHRTKNFIHEPMYIVADLAIGGHWPGDPDRTTPWPAHFDIDYIRAYKYDPDATTPPPPPPTEPVPEPEPTETDPLLLPLSGKPKKWLRGTNGDDVIDGTSRNDHIDGLEGDDRMTGGQGDDRYIVKTMGDTVIEQADQGIDT